MGSIILLEGSVMSRLEPDPKDNGRWRVTGKDLLRKWEVFWGIFILAIISAAAWKIFEWPHPAVVWQVHGSTAIRYTLIFAGFIGFAYMMRKIQEFV